MQLTDTDRDMIVAALLTIPVIEPGARPQERIRVFEATLEELRRRDGAAVRSSMAAQDGR